MKQIQINGMYSSGHVALVDDQDWEYVKERSWHLTPDGYAAAQIDGRTTLMQRHLLGIEPSQIVRHRNRVKLDNRRDNLQVARKSSRYRGVSWSKEKRRWKAQICHQRTFIALGAFESPEDAARVYDAAALQHFGDKARLNFVLP